MTTPADRETDMPRESCPDDIRARGWTVAVHNDYRLNGEPHTFWLFTRAGACVKGEGRTDGEALQQVRKAIATPAATSDVLPQEPAGRELPDGPGFWQRYGEKWVIRQHTESMFFGCHCDANGYLGRTIAVLPKGGWRRADAGEATVGSVAYYEPQLEMLRQALTTARTSLPEACRRLKVLEPLGPNIAENLGVVESDGDFDFVLIRIPLAQAREMLAALTWEETNDG